MEPFSLPPEWVQDAIFYQIFPDRFYNGEPGNDPPNVCRWGSLPSRSNFCGGDLAGVMEKLPYLLDLGVNAIYFNPIFKASSNHRYNTYDYFQIDPLLGTQETFQRLLHQAHQHGIRIVLDGVFNHCGRGFFPFHDILENGSDSFYLDWFHVRDLPLRAYAEDREQVNYECWWNIPSLPKFNTDTPAVRQFLFSVARHWLQQGIDGWRLDVPGEIDDDSFWQEFRRQVKGVHPEAYILGEIWFEGTRWLQGDQFDGIMNYELRTLLLEWLIEDKYRSLAFAHRLQDILDKYPPLALFGQMNVLGSHDTARLMTLAQGDVDTVKMLWLFVMTWPGAPCIYYGDEIGLTGDPDPDCRRCFPWDKAAWNHSLRGFIRRLIQIRQELPALRRGNVHLLFAHPRQNLYAHGRGEGAEAVIMAMNASEFPRIFDIPLLDMQVPRGTVLQDRCRERSYNVRNGRLEGVWLPPRSGAILAAQR
ncbi:MAG: glycoside hydrolase family 13 protein [Chloroflexia bacterium]|nr:glycoside hydrolase family 13 protein [Chloroflexia bacterium]